MNDFLDVAIIGGGYTGTVLALHLARLAPAHTRIGIIEPRAELGSGLAYSTPANEHRINVPADRMGVAGAPADRFDVWLKYHHPELYADGEPEHTYVARRWFGDFVRDRLAEALKTSHVGLQHIQSRASALRSAENGLEIIFSGAAQPPLRARHVVIAVSHDMPALPHGIPDTLLGAPGLIEDPWNGDLLNRIPTDGDVFIIGTGLTMADVVASLIGRNHRGYITAMSRNGLLSREAGPAGVPPGLDFSAWPAAPVATYVKLIRAEIDRAEKAGYSWRGVFTALREQGEHLWRHLPREEKRRFLRHLKAFYDAHRYRMAPETYDLIEKTRTQGQFELVTAKLVSVVKCEDGFDVAFCRRGGFMEEHRLVAAIFNCTGPKPRLRADPTHFLGALIASGVARPDPLGLGLDVDRDFHVVGPSPHLYAIGPLTRERFGDTYGAPEIQLYAERLADQLATTLSKEKVTAANILDRQTLSP